MNFHKIGQRIRARRISSGKTQSGLARAASVHKNTVGKIERGECPEVSIAVLAKVCLALGVRLSWVIR